MKVREMDAPQQSCPSAYAPVPQPRPMPAVNPSGSQSRRIYRERDYGIGYGNSSGYASLRHFTDGHVDPLFRLG